MNSTRLVPMVLGLTVGIAIALHSDDAEARKRGGHRFRDTRGYVELSPGVIYVPLADDDVTDWVDVGYQWGFGVGGVFHPGPVHIGLGFNFEHQVYNLDEDFDDLCDFIGDITGRDGCRYSAHGLHLQPNLRIGGGRNQLMGYGYIAPGMGIVTSYYNDDRIDPENRRETDLGFVFGIGGGIQYLVWKGLAIGGELGFDIGVFPDDDNVGGFNNGYEKHTMDIKFLVAYWW